MASAAIALVVLIFGLAACGGSDGDTGSGSGQAETTAADSSQGNLPTGKEAPPGQEITVASSYSPITLDPQLNADGGLIAVTWRINEGLTYRDADGKFVPALASELPTQINPTTWEIKLVKDAEFSSGTPFDADAAVFSFERIMDPDYATAVGEVATLKGIKKIDEYTIHLTTTEPDLAMVNKLSAIKMVDPKNPDIDNTPIGTGPYMLESYSPGSQAVLVANPKYRGEQPQVSKVTLKFIPDEGTRLQALQAGEVDLVPSVSPDQLGGLDYYVPTKGEVWSGILRLNAYDDLLSDQKVREALNYAVDKEGIAESLFAGYASVSPCQLNGFEPDADKTLEPYPYDPDKARELIEEAGATGKKLTIDWPTGGYTMDRQMGEIIQEQLSATGLDVTVRFNSYEKNVEKVYVGGPKAGQALYIGVTDPLGDLSRNIVLFLGTEGPISVYSNAELDKQLKAAGTSGDAEERAEAYREVLRTACDQAAMLYLIDWADLFALSERLSWQPGVNSAGGRLPYEDMTVIESGN